jgi:pterin-4a-carbinolamine dehydratase
MRTEAAAEEPTAGKSRYRLEAEKVQERLRRIPGWQLIRGGRAIDRLREFPSSRVAVAYAGFVAELAATVQAHVDVLVTRGQVVVTIHGNAARRGGALPQAALELAEFLG